MSGSTMIHPAKAVRRTRGYLDIPLVHKMEGPVGDLVLDHCWLEGLSVSLGPICARERITTGWHWMQFLCARS